MVVDSNSKIRLFLLGCGFVQDPQGAMIEDGNIYRYYIPETRLMFIVNLYARRAEARYPDFDYNRGNPYNTKQCVTTFDWQIDNSKESIVENLTGFFDRITTLVKEQSHK